MELKILPAENLRGEIKVPGDKSISHRALIFSALADGESNIKGLLEADDCLKTREIIRSLGIEINRLKKGEYIVKGKGVNGLQEPSNILDCGNSGTAMRLLAGLLAGQNFYSVLTGDESLRGRPMDRIKKPLARMGAKIWSRRIGQAPLSIKGDKLKGIEYNLPVASAQVKSSILLAGLYAEGKTIVREPAYSRDHTERMFKAVGIDIKKQGREIILTSGNRQALAPLDIEIPGDISSAAFLITAALVVPHSSLMITGVGVNPTRSGFLEVVKEMNGNLELLNYREISGEPVADILVKTSSLKGIRIDGKIIPRLIDEVPIIAVLASQAEGKTIIRNAEELRVKETDRLKAIKSELVKLGVDIEELEDGLIIEGPARLQGGITVDSYQDHRIAMALAIAGLIAEGGLKINNSEVISTSFPGFKQLLTGVL